MSNFERASHLPTESTRNGPLCWRPSFPIPGNLWGVKSTSFSVEECVSSPGLHLGRKCLPLTNFVSCLIMVTSHYLDFPPPHSPNNLFSSRWVTASLSLDLSLSPPSSTMFHFRFSRPTTSPYACLPFFLLSPTLASRTAAPTSRPTPKATRHPQRP